MLKGLVKIGVAAFAAYSAIGGITTGLLAIQSPPDAVPELIRIFVSAPRSCALS